ncbi:hypothetical protein V3C99_000947 [Haemonchus contortus]
MGLITLNLREPPIRQRLGRTARERLLKSQVQNGLPKRRRTTMAICTFNARTLASEACIEDLMMQANKIKNVVIRLTERRRHRQLHAASDLENNFSLEHAAAEGRWRKCPRQYVRP